jgi:hypothetical protein
VIVTEAAADGHLLDGSRSPGLPTFGAMTEDMLMPRPVRLMIAAVALITSFAFFHGPTDADPASTARVTIEDDDGLTIGLDGNEFVGQGAQPHLAFAHG